MANWQGSLESMALSMKSPWMGLPVFVTGHTGFKGSWLSLWLCSLGAKVHGFALPPPTSPSHFEVARIGERLASDRRGNILDFQALQDALEMAQPQVVFHLAAQPLVRQGYIDPLGTFSTNIIGTVHLLEGIRHLSCVKAVIIVTTDKVYQNQEWIYPYRENDPLGGSDPYSASKSATEIITNSYRLSFFSGRERMVGVATARAGNVIGGGDWSSDRLVPDCLKAFVAKKTVILRHPHSIRPWQHVLESLSGYLCLAEKLLFDPKLGTGWNFGPNPEETATVQEIAETLKNLWGADCDVKFSTSEDYHETSILRLDNSRARYELGWNPRWTIKKALVATVDWHRAWLAGEDMMTYSLRQIQEYQEGQS